MAAVAPDAPGVTDRFAVVAGRLLAAAEAIARAWNEEHRLQRTDPAARWRKAALLWPGFGDHRNKG